ncbi:MAG: flagellar hook-basal body complex protein [Selenomonadaceae bacterium]|nr:flagellar hook-basal body complex protein [Selenomonadaceae bacterium]
MMRSLFSGVSGLKVHQTRMDVIGNNIANINTIGFKSSRTTFSDMLSQIQSSAAAPTDNLGGVNAKQIGLGVNVESIDIIFSDSSPQQTGKNTDLALSGNGLFVLRDGNQSFYTRNGAFAFDEAGYYVLPGSGLRVQGWNATDGVINTNGTATDIVVPVGKTMEAVATTTIDYNGNLNKESLIITSIQPTQKTDGNMTLVTTTDTTTGEYTSVNVDGENALAAVITLSDGTTMNVTSGYYEVGKSIPVTTLATIYDSLGGRHEVTLLIDKDPNSTDANLTDEEALATATIVDANNNKIEASNIQVTRDTDGNVTGYTYTDANNQEQTATTDQVIFNNRWRVYIAPGVGQTGPADTAFTNSYTRSAENENPEADGSSTTGTMNEINFIYFSNTGQFISNGQDVLGSIEFTYGDGNGAADQNASITFAGMTQYANSTTSFPITDGNTAGILQSLAIDGNGVISGTYTNGLVRSEAQIAVAQFNNSSGLTKVGTTIYTESNNSGAANIKTIADFGLNVVSSALEMSNVDLATEFSDMIITQRGFQANSKMTTVSDEMLETLVNMKR